jgi:hypothetical protein
MRLWTVHPRYLDSQGLVAAWREGLLAQKVLAGGTRGYRSHPQLLRFRAQRQPLAAIAAFLRGIAGEAARRGYAFDASKIARPSSRRGRAFTNHIPETKGQLLYEWGHLQEKLRRRAPAIARELRGIDAPEAHPLFRIVAGGVRDWEKQRPRAARAADRRAANAVRG